jgi:hypothetical protein
MCDLFLDAAHEAQIHNIQSYFLMYVMEILNHTCFIHVPLTQTCACAVRVEPVIFLEISYI